LIGDIVFLIGVIIFLIGDIIRIFQYEIFQLGRNLPLLLPWRRLSRLAFVRTTVFAALAPPPCH
jgi:hypothetical protein